MKTTIEHPEDSLDIIREMIAKSRQSFNHNSFYFLFWGVMMFVAGLTEYLLIRYDYEWYWVGWPVFGVLGGVVSGVYSARQERISQGSTFTDQIIGYVWMTYGISLVCIIVTSVLVSVNPGTLVLLLTGLPTALTGMILRHKPLVFGGIVFWIGGVFSIFLTDQYVPLVFCGAILLGYLFPGYTLMAEEKRADV